MPMGPTTICRQNIVRMKGNVSSFWCYLYGSLLALVTNHWPQNVFMKVSWVGIHRVGYIVLM